MIRFFVSRSFGVTVPSALAQAGLLLTAVLSACTPSDLPPEATAEAAAVTLHYPGDERVFSPADWNGLRFLVFASLFRWDDEGEMQGWLADRWEHSEDFRTWTYHIREDARWHDGVPVTTADIEFTLGLLSHPEVLVLNPDEFQLTVFDDHTFTVEAETAEAMGYMQWEIVCFPRHLLDTLDPAEYYDWDWWIEPVGNGPFRYLGHLPKTSTELEADPHYFLDGPALDRVRIRYGGAPFLELAAGSVDVVRAPIAEALQVASDPEFVIWPDVPRGFWAIFWNQNRPQFRDAKTRAALTMAVDRRSLYAAMSIPDDIPVIDAPLALQGARTTPEPFPYDPARAGSLLEEAGWQDRDGDGILERAGQAFRFEVLAFAGGAEGAVLVQENLRQVGVDMDIVSMEMSVVRGRLRGGDFDAGIFRTSRGYLANYLFGSRDILEVQAQGLQSPTGYSNPTVLAALEEEALSFGPGAGRRASEILWREFQRDVPVTYLHPELDVLVTPRRIQGLRTRGPFMWMDQVRVGEPKDVPDD